MTSFEVAVGAGAAFILGCGLGIAIIFAAWIALQVLVFVAQAVARIVAAVLGLIVYGVRKARR